MSELTMTSPPGGKAPPEVTAAAASARRRRVPPTPEQLEQKRQDLHKLQHAAAPEQPDDDAEQALPPEEPRENVDSIEIKLRDGRMVVFGPPEGISLTIRISQILGARETEAMHTIARVCMCVRSIDGKKPPSIGNAVDLQKVANLIGDNGLDSLGYLLGKFWPPVKLSELEIVKKNLRE